MGNYQKWLRPEDVKAGMEAEWGDGEPAGTVVAIYNTDYLKENPKIYQDVMNMTSTHSTTLKSATKDVNELATGWKVLIKTDKHKYLFNWYIDEYNNKDDHALNVMRVSVDEFWKSSDKLKNANKNIGVFENVAPNEVIGTTQGFGADRSGANAKQIYSKFDHPKHKNFDARDHDAAADAHGTKMFDIRNKMFPIKNDRSIYLSKKQKEKLESDPDYKYHLSQKNLHDNAARELSKDKTAELNALLKQRQKNEIIFKREIAKRVSADDKHLIEVYRTELKYLKPYTPDDVVDGRYVKNIRADRRNKIEKILKKYYDMYYKDFDIIVSKKLRKAHDIGVFDTSEMHHLSTWQTFKKM